MAELAIISHWNHLVSGLNHSQAGFLSPFPSKRFPAIVRRNQDGQPSCHLALAPVL